MFFRTTEKPPLDRRRSLAGVPTLNGGVTTETNAAGHLTVRAKRPRGKGFLARFQPPVMERTMKLDELGSFVFRQIDGRSDARAIIEAFIARYRTNRREAELSTIAFLKSLAERGVISIMIP